MTGEEANSKRFTTPITASTMPWHAFLFAHCSILLILKNLEGQHGGEKKPNRQVLKFVDANQDLRGQKMSFLVTTIIITRPRNLLKSPFQRKTLPNSNHLIYSHLSNSFLQHPKHFELNVFLGFFSFLEVLKEINNGFQASPCLNVQFSSKLLLSVTSHK